MTNRQLERKYIELQEAIRNVGGVECSQLPDAFFPEDELDHTQRRQMIKVAKLICQDCPIKDRCLDYAISAHMQGIWGGTTADERRAMKSS